MTNADTEHRRCPPRVIGLAGGIASGKSLVAEMFAQLGAVIIDADAIAKEVLDTADVRRRLRQEWGEAVFDAQGRPDRARIAQLVFHDAEKLRQLTSWVHPATLQAMRVQLDKALDDPSVALVVIDAPLLLEGQADGWCDEVVFVDAAPWLRSGRARDTRRWENGELTRRESLQMRLDEKRRRAGVCIDNNGSQKETFEQVKRLFREWTR